MKLQLTDAEAKLVLTDLDARRTPELKNVRARIALGLSMAKRGALTADELDTLIAAARNNPNMMDAVFKLEAMRDRARQGQ